MKTHKALRKRIKVTKTGKTLVRSAGHGHFNAKASRKKQLKKKQMQILVLPRKHEAKLPKK